MKTNRPLRDETPDARKSGGLGKAETLVERCYKGTSGFTQTIQTIFSRSSDGTQNIVSQKSTFKPPLKARLDESGHCKVDGRITVDILGEELVFLLASEETIGLGREVSQTKLPIDGVLSVHPDYYLTLRGVDSDLISVEFDREDTTWGIGPFEYHAGAPIQRITMPEGTSFFFKVYELSAESEDDKWAHFGVMGDLIRAGNNETFTNEQGTFDFTFTTTEQGVAGWNLQRPPGKEARESARLMSLIAVAAGMGEKVSPEREYEDALELQDWEDEQALIRQKIEALDPALLEEIKDIIRKDGRILPEHEDMIIWAIVRECENKGQSPEEASLEEIVGKEIENHRQAEQIIKNLPGPKDF